MLKFVSLGSGSAGNALLVSARSGITKTNVLIDCGFSLRQITLRLQKNNISPSDISAIIVTHEHKDHIGGVFPLAQKYGIPVWMSYGTHQAVMEQCEEINISLCRDTESFEVGDICITPYTVPHDAKEPLQYHLTDGQSKLGILTDAGQVTDHMVNALAKCDALIMEFNHDEHLLADSSYPPYLKQRIRGSFGHLSNIESKKALSKIDTSCLKKLVCAHLSEKNNTPQLARESVQEFFGADCVEIFVASQHEGTDWLDL